MQEYFGCLTRNMYLHASLTVKSINIKKAAKISSSIQMAEAEDFIFNLYSYSVSVFPALLGVGG